RIAGTRRSLPGTPGERLQTPQNTRRAATRSLTGRDPVPVARVIPPALDIHHVHASHQAATVSWTAHEPGVPRTRCAPRPATHQESSPPCGGHVRQTVLALLAIFPQAPRSCWASHAFYARARCPHPAQSEPCTAVGGIPRLTPERSVVTVGDL